MQLTYPLAPLALAWGLTQLALAVDPSSVLAEASSVVSVETNVINSLIADPTNTALASSALQWANSLTAGPLVSQMASLSSVDPADYNSFESSAGSVLSSQYSALMTATAMDTATATAGGGTTPSASATSSSVSGNGAAGVARSLVAMGIGAAAVAGLAVAL